MSVNANSKRAPNNQANSKTLEITAQQAITKTLEITANFAFRLLRNGKYRRASRMANEALLQLPPTMRKGADALALRMIGSSGRHIADWFAAEDASRKRKKRTRRTGRASGEVVPMALATSHLLLVPEYPMVPVDSPAEVGEKQ
jgi:hypothetical protein